MEYHPAANIFPLDEEHIPELAEDIKTHGLLCPVEVMDGKILDGRRRWLACEQAGVEADWIEVNPDDPIAYVKSLNLNRRHLTVSQASMCAARCIEMYEEQAKDRQKQSKGRGAKKGSANRRDLLEGKASDHAGADFGVSGRSVDRAKTVQSKGIPALKRAVDRGRISLNRAEAIAMLPEDVQEQQVVSALTTPQSKSPKARTKKQDEEPEPGKLRGKGIFIANEAIDCLKRIPKNDALRKRGFQLVTDWIRHNK